MLRGTPWNAGMRRHYFDLVISVHVCEDDDVVILLDLNAAQTEALPT